MDTEKIVQDLNRRFAAPLPEFYKRRIIVWIDEDGEFADKLEEITLENAKLVALTGGNSFAVKKLLAVDDPTGNYLIYRPFAYDSDNENWLLDVELYSEEFRADLVSIWMDEMGIQQTPALRGAFKQYHKFFNAQTRRNKLTSLGSVPSTPAGLQIAIMATIAGLKDAKPDAIIRAVLKAGISKKDNAVYQEFVNFEIDDAFWRMVSQGTGYQDANPDLGPLAAHILLTAVTRTMRQEFLAGLHTFISSAHQAYCYNFTAEWLHGDDSESVYRIAERIESELKLPQRFVKLQLADLTETEIFPCVDEVILVKMMHKIADNTIDADTITSIVEKRRTCVWYDTVRTYYEGILQLAKMQAFYKEHAAGFHTVEPAKIWQEYTAEYYVMDGYYRKFHRCYTESLKKYHPELSDPFAHVLEQAEGLYITWYLGQIGSSWSNACEDHLREYGRILEVPQQADFYRQHIESADSRVYVIISDALRYEVAAELAEQLRRETQAAVDLKSMQSAFPSTTKYGMAALLPHKHIYTEIKGQDKTEHLSVMIDGQSSESPNRDKILKAANQNSVAIKYKDVIVMKRADRQALVKGMDVVYIYHDAVDEAGHLETAVFEACDTAIEEIKNLVRIIVNDFGGANILITADHGFLYTHKPLKEDDKVNLDSQADQQIEIGRRYAIMQSGYQSPYLMPVKFILGDNPHYNGFAPRENIRIKTKGGGMNYVHGGISLQELVVPLIEYHFLRNQSKEYKKNRSKYDTKPVEISLLSAERKISNMIFSLNFYQKEAVGGNREAASYQLCFTDSTGKVISDIQRIIADKTSDNGQERTFRCSFSLKPLKYSSTETYYLVIADENGMEIQREEFQIDIAFAVDDFDFFS